MNNLFGLIILLVGMAIGWLLHSTIESMRQAAVTPLTEAPHNTDQNRSTLTPNEDRTDTRLDQKNSNSENQHNTDFDELMVLLKTGRDVEAIEWYANQSRIEGRAEAARRRINQHVRARQQQNEIAGAVNLLKLLITQLPLAFSERMALAALYNVQRQFYEALKVLFDTLAVASSATELTQLDQLIQQTVNTAQDSMSADDVNAHIELYQFLIAQRASHTPYYIELAAWLIKASRLDAAMAPLNVVQNDPFVGDVAQKMMLDIEAQRQRQLETPVALLRNGSHFIVEASLNHSEVRLLLDTGASLTVLSREVARALGLRAIDAQQTVTINTANGTTEAQLYRVESIVVGAFDVSPIDIAVVDQLAIEGASGLLGMNFLEHFDFRIDQEHAELFLRYRD